MNKELKKLLVASMGSDLQTQMEGSARDRAQLAQDLENTMTTLLKEREVLEKVNIQCDVWRSKFLGSRYILIIIDNNNWFLYRVAQKKMERHTSSNMRIH